jgi:dihydropteroate synthase
VNRATVAGVSVGDGLDVAVVGALNVSPESFYSGSVVTDADRLLRAAQDMAEAGAAWLDVGAMSTAPYLEARIPETQEADRLRWAVGLLTAKLDIPVCADMAAPAAAPAPGAPIETVSVSLAGSLARARAAGVPDDRILLDPGIGFFRDPAIAWPEWDCRVLAGLPALRSLGRPLYVGVSRKSFIGALAGAPDPADRLPGTLAATAAAVLGGAHVIRAHDVAETAQAVRIAQAIRRAGAEGA